LLVGASDGMMLQSKNDFPDICKVVSRYANRYGWFSTVTRRIVRVVMYNS